MTNNLVETPDSDNVERTPAERAEATRLATEINARRAAEAEGRDLDHEAELDAAATKALIPDDRWAFLAERGEEWLGEEPAPRRYLLSDATAGVLPLGRVGMLVAGGGMGKSWALTQLALAVATGKPWLGWKVDHPGAVLLALGEEELDEMRRRIYYAGQEMGLTAAERALAGENLLPLALAGEAVALTHATEPGEEVAVETPFYQALWARLGATGVEWRLLVLDPVSRFGGGDVEIDNAAATRFVQHLERLSCVPGDPTVLIAHHSVKGARSGRSSATAARGSSALVDGVRWVANLDPLTEPVEKGAPKDTPPEIIPGAAVLRVTKSNYGRYPEEVFLRRSDEHHGALRAVSEAAARGTRAQLRAVSVVETEEEGSLVDD